MSHNSRTTLNTIEKCFSEAAATYDTVADIQKRSSQMLVSLIDPSQDINSVIDIGCGTGITSLALYKKYPNANYTLCDISPAMLQRAKGKFPRSVELLCTNAEKYRFSATYDLGISNMSLQWFEDIECFLSKILKNCPHFAFSTLMLGSFQSYSQNFEVSPTFRYPSEGELLNMCAKAGRITDYRTQQYVKKYTNMFAVLKYFRKLGAHMKSQNNPILKKDIGLNIPISLEYNVFFAYLSH